MRIYRIATVILALSLVGATRQPPQLPYLDSLQRAGAAATGNDPATALALLEEALRLEPEGAEAFRLLGRVYLGLGKPADAAAALRRAVELQPVGHPDRVETISLLAYSLWQQESDGEALEILQDVTRSATQRPGLHLLMGQIHLQAGRNEEAVEAFRREILLSSSGALVAHSYEGLGIAAYRMGDTSTALDALSRTSTLQGRYHLGLSLARVGRYEEARDVQLGVLRQDPRHRGALQSLAQCAHFLRNEEQRDAVQRQLEELYEQEQQRRLRRVRGGDLIMKARSRAAAGDREASAALLEAALRQAPEDPTVLMELGRSQHETGQAREAEQTFLRLTRLQPLDAEAHHWLGRVLAARGELDRATVALRRAVQLAPLNPDYHYRLAEVFFDREDLDDAIVELRLGARLAPDEPVSHFNLGLGLERLGSLEEAARALRMAEQQGYRGSMVHRALHRIYRRLGDDSGMRREQEALSQLESIDGLRF